MRSRIAFPLAAALILATTAGLLRAQVAWVARFDDALKQARAEQKLIVVDINRDDEAFELMNAMLRASPSRSTKETVKELLAEMPAKYRKGDREYENAVKKAQENLKKRKFDEALELANKAEALAPQDPQAHLLIAAANIQGSAQEGDPARKSARIATGLQELRLARCLDREDMSSFLAAKGYLASRYLRFEANSPEAQKSFLEGETRFSEGRLKEAVAAYAKTIQLDPDFGKAYLYMGDCFLCAQSKEEPHGHHENHGEL